MSAEQPVIGVLSLQGAFEEHQECLHSVGCQTIQVRTASDLQGLDGIVLPGGESTAMGLIGTGGKGNLWDALRNFSREKPTWGTCAGMILLAEKCVGASAVIQDGQALIGGMNVLVCRNYFGSQISSFEMKTPAPPESSDSNPYPGIFIRAPAILSVAQDVEVLGRVVATPCRQAAVVLQELEAKIARGENVNMINVVDSLERKDGEGIQYKQVKIDDSGEEKKDIEGEMKIELPGAADGSNAREVICAVRKDHTLCTAFHPELTKDYRWHAYFAGMVKEFKMKN
mmetsp:Transcript_8275/g.12735  ORF Transcript_8275/g.12735 Transcript_8275/m.12735 type:complete len:285 (+) Transcript_8275:148-1002(+)|eukprot:CAMPEP_0178919264 /NCGR_PEP_ID=MMETSP0786-20121207/14335_1 /TAXON_ID=186022 /ORGANISM="Thalassionema frauenfeldii, Strain CCMP 1798" /LENGTH=284 /DNA_ID=CAMNT_0020593165 /DNA_START=73 /DNA_END=927 /DNA_ORIENTATION=-